MRTPIFIAGFVGFLVCASASFAGEAAYEQRLARGIAAVEIGDYPAAEREFQAALLEKPGDPAATLYNGIALSRAGKAEAEEVLKSAIAAAPGDPRTHYELGVYYFRGGKWSAAAPYFEKTVSLAPDTKLSRSAQEYLDAIPGRSAAKRWSLNLSAGAQYDTNVVLGPDDRPLLLSIPRIDDWRAVFMLKARYNLVSDEKWDASVGYAFYQSVHRDLDDFNIRQSVVDLKGGVRLTRSVALRGTYVFGYYNLGGDRYGYNHLLSPSIVISEGPGWFTTLEYKWRRDTFRDGPFFPNNSDRNGSWQSVGITQNLSISKDVNFKAGYVHDWDDAKVNWWSYNGNQGFAQVGFKLPYRTFLDFSADYHSYRYDGVFPTFGVIRRDYVWTVAATAGMHLTDRYTLFIGEAYTNNSSNIADFNYNRYVTSIFLNARF